MKPEKNRSFATAPGGFMLKKGEVFGWAALLEGNPDAQLRAEGRGLNLHVVQLAGCEPRWMAATRIYREQVECDIEQFATKASSKRLNKKAPVFRLGLSKQECPMTRFCS